MTSYVYESECWLHIYIRPTALRESLALGRAMPIYKVYTHSFNVRFSAVAAAAAAASLIKFSHL